MSNNTNQPTQTKLQLVLTSYKNWGNEDEKESYIDALEGVIEEMNQQARDGNPTYSDGIYDTCMDYLRELNPDSDLLHVLWSEDDEDFELDEDTDRYLTQYPMLSIQSIKHLSDKPIERFKSLLPAGDVQVIVSMKENGHGMRETRVRGDINSATSRGRATSGKDLTNQARIITGEHIEGLSQYNLVELRGEALLPFDKLEEARKHNPNIKSAFTGVASMIRASAPPEETNLLDLVYYDMITDEEEFETLSEKYEFMESIGLTVPLYYITTVNRKSLEEDLNRIVEHMDILSTDYPYYTDGLVVTIDDISLFTEFGAEDTYRLGNLALKIGRWAQDSYTGIVSHIEWTKGKSRKTPVAILEEPILTATGASVTNIPLYAPAYLLALEAYPGNVIHFRFGGEAGVIPTTADGRLVTDKFPE